MTGKLIQLLPRTQYDYKFLGSSATAEVVIAQAIPIQPFYRVKLVTRVHGVDIGKTANFQLNVYSADPSTESTDLFFNSTAAISRTISSATSAGAMLENDATDIGPFAYVTLDITQAFSAVNLFCDISVDLLLRSGG